MVGPITVQGLSEAVTTLREFKVTGLYQRKRKYHKDLEVLFGSPLSTLGGKTFSDKNKAVLGEVNAGIRELIEGISLGRSADVNGPSRAAQAITRLKEVLAQNYGNRKDIPQWIAMLEALTSEIERRSRWQLITRWLDEVSGLLEWVEEKGDGNPARLLSDNRAELRTFFQVTLPTLEVLTKGNQRDFDALRQKIDEFISAVESGRGTLIRRNYREVCRALQDFPETVGLDNEAISGWIADLLALTNSVNAIPTNHQHILLRKIDCEFSSIISLYEGLPRWQQRKMERAYRPLYLTLTGMQIRDESIRMRIEINKKAIKQEEDAHKPIDKATGLPRVGAGDFTAKHKVFLEESRKLNLGSESESRVIRDLRSIVMRPGLKGAFRRFLRWINPLVMSYKAELAHREKRFRDRARLMHRLTEANCNLMRKVDKDGDEWGEIRSLYEGEDSILTMASEYENDIDEDTAYPLHDTLKALRAAEHSSKETYLRERVNKLLDSRQALLIEARSLYQDDIDNANEATAEADVRAKETISRELAGMAEREAAADLKVRNVQQRFSHEVSQVKAGARKGVAAAEKAAEVAIALAQAKYSANLAEKAEGFGGEVAIRDETIRRNLAEHEKAMRAALKAREQAIGEIRGEHSQAIGDIERARDERISDLEREKENESRSLNKANVGLEKKLATQEKSATKAATLASGAKEKERRRTDLQAHRLNGQKEAADRDKALAISRAETAERMSKRVASDAADEVAAYREQLNPLMANNSAQEATILEQRDELIRLKRGRNGEHTGRQRRKSLSSTSTTEVTFILEREAAAEQARREAEAARHVTNVAIAGASGDVPSETSAVTNVAAPRTAVSQRLRAPSNTGASSRGFSFTGFASRVTNAVSQGAATVAKNAADLNASLVEEHGIGFGGGRKL